MATDFICGKPVLYFIDKMDQSADYDSDDRRFNQGARTYAQLYFI